MRKSCCDKCIERHTGCHSTCIRFFAESMAYDIEKDAARKKKTVENQAVEFRITNIMRDKKRYKTG